VSDGFKTRTGTSIKFKADKRIFDALNYKYNVILKRLKESAYLNNGLKIIVEDKRKKETKREELSYEGGIKSFVKHLNQKNKTISNIVYLEEETEDCYSQIAFQYNKGYTKKILSFTNNINTVNGGYHVTGFKTALTRAVNHIAKKHDLLPKKIDKLPGSDIRDGLVAIISVRIPEPQFEGQTKAKLGNSEVKSKVERPLYDFLINYFEDKPEDVKGIIDKAIESIKAREASKKARKMARKSSKLVKSKLPGKLSDCSNKKREKSEIFFVEGDSAGGSAKQARDRRFQAILPLKGKILNVERRSLSNIIKNNEISSIIKSIGTGIGQSFDIDNLRYDKIIIMTDADVDGAHITTLILTLFYRYLPELIKNDNVYIALSPLYKVKYGRKEEYIYREENLEEFREEHPDLNFSIQRYKGLGEMNPEQLWHTTMDPETRKLEKVDIINEMEANDIFDILMGRDASKRKNFIFNNADLVKEQIEV
jgi:DNA gyrase subunit B